MTSATTGAADAAQALEVLRGAAAMAQPLLEQPLASYATREPVSCPPDAPIRTVLETMGRERIGAMVVVDALRRPLGVFTLRDVLEKVALQQVDLALPVAKVMAERVWTLPGNTPGFEAALLMAREGIRYVLVVEEGRLVGVVSESQAVLGMERRPRRHRCCDPRCARCRRCGRRRLADSRARRASARAGPSPRVGNPCDHHAQRSGHAAVDRGVRRRAADADARAPAGSRSAARAAPSRRLPPIRTTRSSSPTATTRKRTGARCCRSRAR